MTIDLKLYDGPRILPLTDLNPGHILEAPGGAGIESRRSRRNCFGYVRGSVARAVPRKYNPGEILVEDVFPRREEFSHEGNVYLDNVFQSGGWKFPKKPNELFLVIGELSNPNEANGSDRYSQFLASDAVTLSEEQRIPVIEQLINYSHKKDSGVYVFKTPDGQEFGLNELIGGLKQK